MVISFVYIQLDYQEDEPEVNPEGFFNDLTNQNACSVRVAVRVRPLIGRELNEGGIRTCVDVNEVENKLQIGEKNFQFDRVFSSDSEQNVLFDVCARNLVLGCFSGFNATILAYGQTGSGKTHTMGTGSTNGLSEAQVGIVPRVFNFIFEELDRRKKLNSLSEFTIKISFLELYNEELHDLLDPANIGAVDKITGKSIKELQIKEKNGNIYVQGLKEDMVSSMEECLQLLNKGISHRTTSATLMNEGSSRSHAIFTIAIEQRIVKEIEVPEGAIMEGKEGQVPGQQEEQITAKFHFVDLAGSERIKRTGATGQLMKEGISINKGLLCLGNVISALTDEGKKDKHIPYRDSKLTRILQDSLGGNSRTTMIACVSPAESNYEETLNAIKYASRARNIKNKPVVNRDPNSMLIDSLRSQINNLQGEIKEYRNILNSNQIQIPENFAEQVQKRVDEVRKTPAKQPSSQMPTEQASGVSQGSINFAELRDVKIKLSRKEKELKDLQELYSQILLKLTQKDYDIQELQKERDTLRLKNEILNEHLQKNNLQLDSSSDNGDTLSLIDEYKQKLEKMEKDLERKNTELSTKNRNIAELQIQSQRDEELLRKHLEENQRLKRQLKKFEEQQTAQAPHSGFNMNMLSSPPPSTKSNPKFKLNLQGISSGGGTSSHHQKSHSITDSEAFMKKKSQLENLKIDAEDLNQKFISNLSSHLESLFQNNPDEDGQPLNSTRSLKKMTFDENLLRTNSIEDMMALNSNEHTPLVMEDENQAQHQIIIEEKEKFLDTVKSSVKQMQSELVELMKHEYVKNIQEIEKDLVKMDTEKQATLRKTTDTKQIQAIESQFKSKMDELTKQLSMYKEKEKKQEQVSKQINVQENKIKVLEEDIGKMKKSKDIMEKQMKTESEKFSKFKQSVSKELTNAKKQVSDKEKELLKLKVDLKKTDQLAQQKMSELRGFQKKVYEDRMRRELEKKEEYDKKGIDIDRIKDWINENTDRMLKHNELKEQLDNKVSEKEQIEDEMLQQGEKLTGLMLSKERKEIEKSQLELEPEPDEGKILELEEELYQLFMEINNLTENLDSLDSSLNFLNTKINYLTEEVISLDIDNIQPLKFSGLQSVEAARVTLQTFFSVLLDLNIYKRDLEDKCIEQDEAILSLNDKIRLLQVRIDELVENSAMIGHGATGNMASNNSSAANNEHTNRVNQVQKDKAIKSIVDLSHKLESALNDKDQYKLKFDNLRKKNKQDQILKEPLQFQAQQQEKDSKFSNLASARANRRQGVSINPDSSLDQTNDSANTTVTTIKSVPNQQAQQNQFRFKQRQLASQKSSTEDQLLQMASQKPAITRNREQQLPQQSAKLQEMKNKKPTGIPPIRKSSSQEKVSLREKLQQKQQMLQKKTPRKMESFSNSKKDTVEPLAQNTQAQASVNLMPRKQLMPTISEVREKPQPKQQLPVPNLRDRRNQRKLENTDEGLAKIDNGDKVHEIDRIKEETYLITSNKSHQERRQSRARAFSKKMHHERGLSSGKNALHILNQDSSGSFPLGNLKEFSENARENSPRLSSQSPHKFKEPETAIDMTDIMDQNQYDHEYAQESVVSPSKDEKNKWQFEEFAQLENYGSRLIGCDSISGKIILVFENFTIREILIETMGELPSINLLEINPEVNQNQELAIGFTIDKELGAIALATSNMVYLFDFADNYTLLTKIEAENIQQVHFSQYNIVVLVTHENSNYLVAYQVDDGSELGQYELKSDGYPIHIRTDNQFIYFCCGVRLGKLNMPDLSALYVIETDHSDIIIDFNLSQTLIITTSKDQSLRCHDIDSGEQCMNPIEDLSCDHLETYEDFILTRCGEGSAILVWRQYPLSIDLTLIDEINLDLPEFEQLDFKMTGKILAKFTNGVSYDLVLLVTSVPEGFLVNALKHKPLSEF